MVGALPVDLGAVKGGVEAVIVNLFSGFKTRDDIDVIHLSYTKEVKETRIVEYASNIRIYFVPYSFKYDLLDYFLNKKVFGEIIAKEKPDLIHIQEITPHLLRFWNYPKKRIVVTQHGIMKEEIKYATGIAHKLKCLFKVYVEKYVFPRFKNVIFISDYNKALYHGGKVLNTRIYNPVNPSFFSKAPVSPVRKNTLMYVGVLSRRKNVGLVIDALERLRQKGIVFELHVVGGFKEAAYEQEIMNKVRTYKLEEQVIFHGWQKQDAIVKLYEQCTCFVLPSLQETLPVSIGEAMALGKIVIASDVGAIREMFKDRQTGFLFRKNDVNELASALEAVYPIAGNATLTSTIRQEAEAKYTPELVARETRDFYVQVIQNNP